jgi:N-acyl-D-amino-acid deacylase
MNRRMFLRTGLLGAAALGASGAPGFCAAPVRKTGVGEAFDPVMESFMAARRVPGGALAVVKDRRLVYARGYGWADREKKIPASASSLFRVASVSKPITAVAVLKLVEERKLDLEALAFDIVRLPPVLDAGRAPDIRLRRITIRQLLQHTAGWDRSQSYDPMFRPIRIAEKTNTPPPASPQAIIRYMLGQPLDFDPGARYAYSNLGYCVLGRIIEQIAGQPYEQFVRQQILAPIGIERARLGASIEARQAPGEVRYYTADRSLAANVYPNGPRNVPWPYGGFHLEAMDAHGGWIASAVDLARFAAALDNPKRSPLLKAPTLRVMYAPPPPPVARDQAGALMHPWYGCGWSVMPVAKNRANYWHNGSLPGTASLLVRRADGLSWAALFNQRSEDRKLPDSDIDPALHRAADSVSHWPSHNLFVSLKDG